MHWALDMVIFKTNFLSFIDPMPLSSLNDWSIILPDINNSNGREGSHILVLEF